MTTDHASYLRRLAVVPFLQPGSDQLAQGLKPDSALTPA
jgi:hypothetical protein